MKVDPFAMKMLMTTVAGMCTATVPVLLSHQPPSMAMQVAAIVIGSIGTGLLGWAHGVQPGTAAKLEAAAGASVPPGAP